MGFIVGVVIGLLVGIAIIIGFVKLENSRSKLRSELVRPHSPFFGLKISIFFLLNRDFVSVL